MFPVDTGRILLDGADITAFPSRRRIGAGIARSFQNIRLMPHLSTLENVMVGQHCRNAGVMGVLQPVNLLPRNRWREEARAALAEAGLGGYERSTVGSLPYGVQKRIELVRALMAHPRLLLLDEPAAGLNPAETEALQAQLEKVCANGGLTLMVVEHDMHFIGALCEHVIVLDFGRKIAEGTPDEIRANVLVQETYLGAPVAQKMEHAGALEAHDLDVRYGRVQAVRGVSIALAEGEIVAVLGANGAGKSSLLRALMGLVQAGGRQRALSAAVTSRNPRPAPACAPAWCWCRRGAASS